eukprot:6178743-Pleurochrysis_carterae.AAC.3
MSGRAVCYIAYVLCDGCLSLRLSLRLVLMAYRNHAFPVEQSHFCLCFSQEQPRGVEKRGLAAAAQAAEEIWYHLEALTPQSTGSRVAGAQDHASQAHRITRRRRTGRRRRSLCTLAPVSRDAAMRDFLPSPQSPRRPRALECGMLHTQTTAHCSLPREQRFTRRQFADSRISLISREVGPLRWRMRQENGACKEKKAAREHARCFLPPQRNTLTSIRGFPSQRLSQTPRTLGTPPSSFEQSRFSRAQAVGGRVEKEKSPTRPPREAACGALLVTAATVAAARGDGKRRSERCRQ